MKPPARTGPRLLLQSHTRHQQSHLSRWHPQSSQRCRNESGEQQSSGIAGGGSSAQVAIAQGTEREQNFLQHRSARDPHSELRTPAPCTRARRIDASHVHLHTHTAQAHPRTQRAHSHGTPRTGPTGGPLTHKLLTRGAALRTALTCGRRNRTSTVATAALGSRFPARHRTALTARPARP